MERRFILLLRLKNKNKVLKKSVTYFLTLMKYAKFFQKKERKIFREKPFQ